MLSFFFFSRCGTTRKPPYWSKRWTPRRGFSSCTGPTPADSSSWRRTRTSKRGLKRWWTKSFIKSAVKALPDLNSFPLTPLGPVRRCQAALDGPVQILGTDLFSCILVGVLLDLLHFVYFQPSIHVCNACVTHTNLFPSSKLLWSLLFRRGNCKKVSVGLQCEVGLRCRTYFVLCGSVLSVWNEVELVLAPVSGANVKVQIVRLRTEDGQRIVGKVETTIWEKKCLLPESRRVKPCWVTELI